ncbi:hypothetical protein BDA96_10G304400 [Sorghum bicolor]|uniref:Uncharacterized protein n=1 Tax=Sorghum bicolor TaxID=4558 RepID=A0A921U2I2_SORBI|nr:hypothetical protein BDA96_10G304400 [Sorghum bicolor]
MGTEIITSSPLGVALQEPEHLVGRDVAPHPGPRGAMAELGEAVRHPVALAPDVRDAHVVEQRQQLLDLPAQAEVLRGPHPHPRAAPHDVDHGLGVALDPDAAPAVGHGELQPAPERGELRHGAGRGADPLRVAQHEPALVVAVHAADARAPPGRRRAAVPRRPVEVELQSPGLRLPPRARRWLRRRPPIIIIPPAAPARRRPAADEAGRERVAQQHAANAKRTVHPQHHRSGPGGKIVDVYYI